MEKEIDNIIKKFVNDGKTIDSIQEIFFKVVGKYEKRVYKTKKNKKKICRPVLLISDSSCDEFDNISR
jgi:hypothetical protein